MKSFLPLLILSVVFASCTTAYKTARTPDDVYFSPERVREEYVRVEEKQDKYRYEDQNDDDRYLRMRIRNRRQWSNLDYYYNDPIAYNYYYNRYNNIYYNNPWNSYSYWNYYYNPYGRQIIIINPKAPVYNKPRQYNLHVFDDPQTSPSNPKATNSKRGLGNASNEPNYSAPRNDAGNGLRRIFGNSSNSGSSQNDAIRTESSGNKSSSNNNSSSNSNSGSSNSGGNAPVRKF